MRSRQVTPNLQDKTLEDTEATTSKEATQIMAENKKNTARYGRLRTSLEDDANSDEVVTPSPPEAIQTKKPKRRARNRTRAFCNSPIIDGITEIVEISDEEMEMPATSFGIVRYPFSTSKIISAYRQTPGSLVDERHACERLKSILPMEVMCKTHKASTSDLYNDAMELIRQDDNYMQRIEDDMLRNCFFCDWVGSKFFLAHHFEQEHSLLIETPELNEWVATFSLTVLHNTLNWVYRVVRYGNSLYLLSAKYDATQGITMVVFHSVSSNDFVPMNLVKLSACSVTGSDNCIWEGLVFDLPKTMPKHATVDTNCMKIQKDTMRQLSYSTTFGHNSAGIIRTKRFMIDIHVKLFLDLPESIPDMPELFPDLPEIPLDLGDINDSFNDIPLGN